MKIHRILVLFSFLLAIPGLALAQVNNGDKAPDFTLTDMKGNEVSLSDYRGQHVVLEWVNPGCPFVVKFYDVGAMQKFQAKAADKGVTWLLINSTTPSHNDYMTDEQTNAYIESRKVKVPWLKDPSGDVARAYGALRTPEMFLICPEGTVLYQGAIDSIRSANSADIERAENYVLAAIEQAAAGQPIANARTRPYGCTIKF
jgi:peroxiredoxin